MAHGPKAVPLTMATRWLDARGREWRIVVKLPFGRNVCTTTDCRYQGDWTHKEIRAALASMPMEPSPTMARP